MALIFSVFALVVAQQGQHPAPGVIPTPTAPGTTVTTTPGGETTVTPTPGVTQGPQNGPTSVSDPVYWDRVLGTQGTNGKVESVSFANVLGTPTLQALVTVRHSNANSTLDVYDFDKITSAKPDQLFKLSGLIKGDAKISYYNSVMTAEVDCNSTLNAGKSSGQWTADLFREFAWSQGAGTLVQVAFPGIFPDLTRYQAEADQASVKAGHDTWKDDPAQVAKAPAVQFMHWTRPLTATVTSGGGAHLKYTAYAMQAMQEGHPEIAKLFLEAAGAETVHGISHLRVVGGITTTLAHLDEAANGENDEIEEMYPRFIREAEAEGRADAAASFRLALEREKHHRAMFKDALGAFER